MAIASLEYRFLQKFNRGGNQRRQNSRPSEVKSFQASRKKKRPSTPEIVGPNRYRWIALSAVSVDIMTLTNTSGSRENSPSERLQWIRKAMREGRPFQPVDLFQIKNEYYVKDPPASGNHQNQYIDPRFFQDKRVVRRLNKNICEAPFFRQEATLG